MNGITLAILFAAGVAAGALKLGPLVSDRLLRGPDNQPALNVPPGLAQLLVALIPVILALLGCPVPDLPTPNPGPQPIPVPMPQAEASAMLPADGMPVQLVRHTPLQWRLEAPEPAPAVPADPQPEPAPEDVAVEAPPATPDPDPEPAADVTAETVPTSSCTPRNCPPRAGPVRQPAVTALRPQTVYRPQRRIVYYYRR